MERQTPIRPELKDRPDLQEIVADVLALRKMAKTDNFLTHKSQRALLANLNPIELAVVARAVAEEERRQQPIYARNGDGSNK